MTEKQKKIYRLIQESPIGTVGMTQIAACLPELTYSAVSMQVHFMKSKGIITAYFDPNATGKARSVYVLAGTPMDGFTERRLAHRPAPMRLDVPYVPDKLPEPRKRLETKQTRGARAINGTIYDPADYGPQDVTRVTNDSHHRELMEELSKDYPADVMAANITPVVGVPLRILPKSKNMQVR